MKGVGGPLGFGEKKKERRHLIEKQRRVGGGFGLWPFGSERERKDLVLFCLFSIRRRTTVLKLEEVCGFRLLAFSFGKSFTVSLKESKKAKASIFLVKRGSCREWKEERLSLPTGSLVLFLVSFVIHHWH